MDTSSENQGLFPQNLEQDSLRGESLPRPTASAIGQHASDLHISISHTSLTLLTSQDPNPATDEEDNKKLFKEWQHLKTKIRSTGP